MHGCIAIDIQTCWLHIITNARESQKYTTIGIAGAAGQHRSIIQTTYGDLDILCCMICHTVEYT